ncbi:hypothetical protein AVEN_105028-1 [Araneus ventricosus]|uniref:Uncharacterized protein n=1 Tax=Araneus ventricosus TaxID=182803 RepID=A0A4Y2GI34_ARAVE|nr:hypothetical protein AVEN_105028-1 [Araneus ventricosus]
MSREGASFRWCGAEVCRGGNGIVVIFIILSQFEFSLVTLASRFEAIRGLFCTDLVILNHGHMTRTIPELAPSLQTSAPPEGRLPLHVSFNRPNTRRIFSGIGFRTWKLSGSETVTLLVGHCGLDHSSK